MEQPSPMHVIPPVWHLPSPKVEWHRRPVVVELSPAVVQAMIEAGGADVLRAEATKPESEK
jgi:hypothetical protein